MELKEKLLAIKKVLELEVTRDCMDDVQDKLIQLTALYSLSAETIAEATKKLHLKELQVLQELNNKGMQASIISKQLNAECFEERAIYDYADRLNSGISHTCDALRTIISLYRAEIENTLK